MFQIISYTSFSTVGPKTAPTHPPFTLLRRGFMLEQATETSVVVYRPGGINPRMTLIRNNPITFPCRCWHHKYCNVWTQ